MKTDKYSLGSFSIGHFFEDLQTSEDFYYKKFFGGLSIYAHGKMVAFLCEKPNSKSWRGKKFKMDIWNGCLIPSMHEYHDQLLKKIEGTSVHPVIEKWLYLPKNYQNFEESMVTLLELINRQSPLVGIFPELKSPKKSKKRKTKVKLRKTGKFD